MFLYSPHFPTSGSSTVLSPGTRLLPHLFLLVLIISILKDPVQVLASSMKSSPIPLTIKDLFLFRPWFPPLFIDYNLILYCSCYILV